VTEKIKKQKEEELTNLAENVEAGNYKLSQKVKSILESKSNDDIKTINIISEVNSANIKNTEELFKIHQRYVFNYNYNFIEFILISYEKIIRIFSPKTIFFLFSLVLGYKYFQSKYLLNKKVEAGEVLKFYRENSEAIFQQDTLLPTFLDHKNITNLIVNGTSFLLIGPKGIGKSYSIKHFCLLEAQKKHVVIYKDLNSVQNIENFHDFITSNLTNFFRKSNGADSIINEKKLFDEMKSKKIIVVLDNFSIQSQFLNRLKNITDILKSNNITVVLVSDSSEAIDFGLQGKLRNLFREFYH
jgi:hypothetical protein